MLSKNPVHSSPKTQSNQVSWKVACEQGLKQSQGPLFKGRGQTSGQLSGQRVEKGFWRYLHNGDNVVPKPHRGSVEDQKRHPR